VVTNFFLSFFEGEGARRAVWRAYIPLASFFLVICVHSSMDEVDNRVLWVNEFSAPSLLEVAFARGTRGCAICCLVLAFSEIFEEGFFSGGSAIRCRIPSSYAMDETVPKQNMDPGWRAILCWKMMAIELAWISDTPPTWCASCRCLGPDRAPGVMKGKCALGPFLSILVIKCQHKNGLSMKLCQMVEEVKINTKV
jgi:hypothetical protein